uniref:Arrestin C-terminal-like domain-containing protein n=1 Tax=Chlamydomonas leiostraca TaxID=1034604 RepID=A0A7S0RPB2_9CHLO|mmetsp:Transcript_27688/g.70534  ORF Transcript_27688/g.70534 Transcript_27688/m.70534 type:complete len:396 (+) Transcript_27688:72-1259(+)
MGQGFSSGNALFVYLDKPHYFPGDVVNGYVLLNCVSAFQASALVLKVEGYEKTMWEERVEDKRFDNDKNEWITDTRTNNYHGRKDFFKLKVPLSSYPQQVNPGQYQYGFTFALPVGLPGSFEYVDSGMCTGAGRTYYHTKAKIKYKVKAEAEVPGILKPNIRHKAYMMVHQRMVKPPSEVIASDNKHIKSCCCMDKGYANMIANIQKDAYYAGEVANVILQVDNKSEAAFREIQLELKRVVVLRADGAGYREMKDSMAKAKFPGVSAGDTLMGGAARVLSLPLPGTLQPTAMGHLVHSEYVLYVTLKAEGTFTSDAKLKVPVAIFANVPDYTQYNAPPPYWQPQTVMPAIQVAMPSAPPLPPPPQVMDDRGYQPPQPTYDGPSAPPAPGGGYPKI